MCTTRTRFPLIHPLFILVWAVCTLPRQVVSIRTVVKLFAMFKSKLEALLLHLMLSWARKWGSMVIHALYADCLGLCYVRYYMYVPNVRN
ncbi:hypothetical protein F4677DRAFT_411856 [Hypoxylon crocopeplum]|nr:hypothetical protein F4677DRAFT_411856 [Hypoxylon crocopeplum]